MHPALPEGEGEGEEHQHDPEVIKEALESGEMLPKQYLLLHPEARVSNEEVQLLIDELTKSMQE